LIRHRDKFRELHIHLRINNTIILAKIRAGNRGGFDENHEQSFWRLQ
jgi:hypothetical protein